jgi:hypothetical protein
MGGLRIAMECFLSELESLSWSNAWLPSNSGGRTRPMITLASKISQYDAKAFRNLASTVFELSPANSSLAIVSESPWNVALPVGCLIPGDHYCRP